MSERRSFKFGKQSVGRFGNDRGGPENLRGTMPAKVIVILSRNYDAENHQHYQRRDGSIVRQDFARWNRHGKPPHESNQNACLALRCLTCGCFP